MRRVLVDHARRRRAAKRGGGARPAPLGEGDGDYPVAAAGDEDTDWEALDRALEELRVLDERRYRVVMLRYFAGLTDAQVARSLEVSEKTVERDWRAARLFLLGRVRELGGG
jgi:RNA polymerase sigma factor (TIGR02999 family)